MKGKNVTLGEIRFHNPLKTQDFKFGGVEDGFRSLLSALSAFVSYSGRLYCLAAAPGRAEALVVALFCLVQAPPPPQPSPRILAALL